MSLCAYHRKYLGASSLQVLTERVKTQWGVDLKLEGHPDDREAWSHMNVSTWGFITVQPCPYGYLAVFESQERLTGDTLDRTYAAEIDCQNWLRMEQALAALKTECSP